MAKKRKGQMCKDCGERYAQEMGRCRRCWTKRIGDKTPINGFSRGAALPAAEREP